ncbi:MAG TPA: MarR family transcriptional regulator [Nitrososphaeraceae archaeon]|jgi:hypothetical protein
MSGSNYDLNESPNHFMVLDAITRGVDNVDKIAKATKLPKEEVETIVNDLIIQRLIAKGEKKGFFKKKTNLGVTEIGLKLLNAKKLELEEKREQMQQSFDNGNGTQLQSYMDANRMWIPMMLFSGIMDVVFFTSMMSFMGIGMNPIESAFTSGDSGAQDAGTNSADTQQVDDHSGSTDASNDSGGGDSNFDGSGMDSGGFDNASFDGFDGGGFDSF